MKSRRVHGGGMHSDFGKSQQFLDELHYTGCLPPLLRQFRRLTGWELAYESIDLRISASWLLDGEVAVDLASKTGSVVSPTSDIVQKQERNQASSPNWESESERTSKEHLALGEERTAGKSEKGQTTGKKGPFFSAEPNSAKPSLAKPSRPNHSQTSQSSRSQTSQSSHSQAVQNSRSQAVRVSNTVSGDADLPLPLTPEMVRNLADDEEELWLPIKISNAFLPEALVSQNAKRGSTHSPIGFLHLYRPYGTHDAVDFKTAKSAAIAVADVLTDFQTVRARLWNLESGVTPDMRIYNMVNAGHACNFSQRFNAMLAYALEALGFDAVAIYMFTNQGSSLHWKTGVNLPLDHQKEPPRPPVPAEMRAMQGEIVVCDSHNHQPADFCIPDEQFESAICLPLMTNRTNFGTLWLYSDHDKYFSEAKIQQAELFADHVALDYEQETFFQRYHTSLEFSNELRATAEFQKNQLPIPQAFQEQLEFFGWTNQTRMIQKLERDSQPAVSEDSVSGDFFDWFTLADGRTVIAIGDVGYSGFVGAALAAAVKSTVRSHAMYQRTASGLLHAVHQTLWPQSAEDYRISLFCGIIDSQKNENDPTEPRRIQCASVGKLHTLYLHEDLNYEVLFKNRDTSASRFLGSSPEFGCLESTLYLYQNESLVLFNPGQINGKSIPVSDAKLANLLMDQHSNSARLQAVFVKNTLVRHVPKSACVDQSVLVIRHRTQPVRKFRKRAKVG